MRKDLIDADLVEAIVQLPVDLFYGAMIPACILVLNRAKGHERKGRVLMIDNSAGFERRDTKNALTNEAINRVIAAYKLGREEGGGRRREREREDRSARVVEIAEISATSTTPPSVATSWCPRQTARSLIWRRLGCLTRGH